MAQGDMQYQSVVVMILIVFVLLTHGLVRPGANKAEGLKRIRFRQIFNLK
jgi:hypothetical protein